MSQLDGGPAFPISLKQEGNPTAVAYGMTLRDYFAGMALQGFLASLDVRVLREAGCMLEEQHRLLATMSYGQADALLRQREA